jgi:phosphoribosylamine--glycine ligase
MKVLIVGGGGREHALAYKAAQSSQVEKVFVAPGNAGTEDENKVENVDINVNEIEKLLEFAKAEEISLTIVGPEEPLVLGIVDLFEKEGQTIFGPSKAAAQLEGSKSFSKDFMDKYAIPTAKYATFTEEEEAFKYLSNKRPPYVIKADGLAAGKGVIIAKSRKEAKKAISEILWHRKFKNAGRKVVIEEFLRGEEASFIVMVDGKNVLAFATSQDHKRAYDNDEGPNTGGMGAYSPAPVVTDKVYERIMRQVILPTVEGMILEGTPYKGFLYAGLMIDNKGYPKVIEYNCRFGDPETQPIMMRLESDLVELCLSGCNGGLDKQNIEFNPQASIGVVMAAKGYPGKYDINKHIAGMCFVNDDVKVFHAATRKAWGTTLTTGGRVLCVASLGDSVSEARDKAYKQLQKISWRGLHYRMDIGHRAIERE